MQEFKIGKRDGTIESFQLAKLRRCIAAALRAARRETHVAEDLAKAVALHLQACVSSGLPTSEYIFRCTQTALSQTGMGDAAQSLAEHRRRRSAQRRSLTVVDSRVEGDAELWKKKRIVATLESEYGVQRTVARILANEIEGRVFSLKYRSVSRALVAELIRNELRAWGLAESEVVARIEAVRPEVAVHPEAEKS